MSNKSKPKKNPPVWTKIPDNKVQHVWKKHPEDDCAEDDCPIIVSPDWYEENGTPMCSCGQDLVYSHTEILKG